MKNKQTATQYFYDRVINIFTKYHEEDVPTIDFGKLITEAFEQAKAMERKQIKEACMMGWMTREYKPIKTEASHSQYADSYLKDIYGL
jgi:hypothetical protein